MIGRLRKSGLRFELDQDSIPRLISEKLKGLTLVITGSFVKHSRDEYKKMIEVHGGKCGSGVTGKTNFLIAGEDCGPAKLEKARSLGVKVISEDEFLSLVT